jgi:hypothetical protein
MVSKELEIPQKSVKSTEHSMDCDNLQEPGMSASTLG